MKVVLNRTSALNFVAQTDSGYQVVMDGPVEIGGENKGARPMEVLLASLGGCSAIDVMMLLQKKRQPIDDCSIEITGERVDAVPAVFRKIHVQYIVYGEELDETKVARSISLSMEKYCSVTKILEHSVEITHGYELRKRR